MDIYSDVVDANYAVYSMTIDYMIDDYLSIEWRNLLRPFWPFTISVIRTTLFLLSTRDLSETL